MKLSTLVSTLSLSATLFLTGCGDTMNNIKEDIIKNPEVNSTKLFEVSVVNLTAGQAFSPIALLAHDDNYNMYSVGSSASVALEKLAEGGDNSELLSSVTQSQSGSGLLTPGSKENITIASDATHLSIASMLVQSNDTFVAYKNINVSTLTLNESWSSEAQAYDTGTEANSESAATVPGQGGEGFNTTRDDVNFVSVSSGIVSKDDGLSTSALTSLHRFDNPVASISIKRIK